MQSNIVCWDDLPVTNFPSVDVIKSLVDKLRSQKEKGHVSVRWGETRPSKYYIAVPNCLFFHLYLMN